MLKFLSQFLEKAQLEAVEQAYKAKNTTATGLPVYISKARLDEEITKRKTAEDGIKAMETTKQKEIDEIAVKLKAIPEDWQQQITTAQEEVKTTKADYEAKLTAANTDHDISIKILESGAKNSKAVRALLDSTKPVNEQLTALKKSDAYLFNKTRGASGTGRQEDSDDDKDEGMTTQKMYAAVGLAMPE